MSGPLELLRTAGLGAARAWLVGGAVRDRLLGRPVTDADIAVEGAEPRAVARALAKAAGGFTFALSEAWGAWRVVAPARDWHVDVNPVRGGSIAADLALRDFTVNAMADPLAPAGGALLDPHGGRADLDARVVRMVGEQALADDPLRVVRAARLAQGLGFAIEPGTLAAARRHAPALATATAPERVWAELRRIVAHPDPVRGLELLAATGATAAVLPELEALRGVDQNRYHHRDVHDHTLEVLEHALDPVAPLADAELEGPLRAHLAAPLAEQLTRGDALRIAALLHDIAKPATRTELADGRIGFPGHDVAGADAAAAILRRLRAGEKLAGHVAALTRHHLRLGFLVRERPLAPRTVHGYLVATAPVTVDVTLLTVADRLATRGDNALPAIGAHLEVARSVLHAALAPPQPPLLRGDEVAAALGLRPGPVLGPLLAELAAAQHAGEVTTREQAVEHLRRYRRAHG